MQRNVTSVSWLPHKCSRQLQAVKNEYQKNKCRVQYTWMGCMSPCFTCHGQTAMIRGMSRRNLRVASTAFGAAQRANGGRSMSMDSIADAGEW